MAAAASVSVAMLAFGAPGAYYAICGRFRDAPADDSAASATNARTDAGR